MSVLFLYHTLSFFYESLSPFSSFSDRAFLSFRSFVVFHSSLPLLYTDINTRSLCGFPLSLNAGHLEKTAPPVCVSVWVQYVCVGYNFFWSGELFLSCWLSPFSWWETDVLALLSLSHFHPALAFSPLFSFLFLRPFLRFPRFGGLKAPGYDPNNTFHFVIFSVCHIPRVTPKVFNCVCISNV